MDDIKDVEDFKRTYGPQYRRLLKTIENLFNGIGERDARARGKIRAVYGRAEKQGGDDFKSSVKIAKKLAQWRVDEPSTQIKDIHDIVGLTVVVYYADYIDQLIEIVLPALADERIVPFKAHGKNPSYHRDFGYHATHLILISEHPAHADLKVEVQFKTMLHDAWGAKTHDLTYKPKGAVNPRIKRLMESLGDSLQAIEIQSETLRAMVSEQGVIDADRRRVVITLMAKGLQGRLPAASDAHAIFEEIQADMEHLSRCGLADRKLVAIKKKIEDNRDTVGDIGSAKLLLYVWLACIRLSDDHSHMAQLCIDELQINVRKSNEGLSYLWGSMLNYFTWNFERAIELSRRGLAVAGIDLSIREKLTNNLCYFLTESCSETPPDLEARKAEATTLRDQLKTMPLSPDIKPAVNLRFGFYDIIFGEKEEEILDGVRQCELSYEKEKQTPDEFVRLLIGDCRRAGWRRILYLDTLKKPGTTGAA